MPVPSGPHWYFAPEHEMKSAPSSRMFRSSIPVTSAPSMTVTSPWR